MMLNLTLPMIQRLGKQTAQSLPQAQKNDFCQPETSANTLHIDSLHFAGKKPTPSQELVRSLNDCLFTTPSRVKRSVIERINQLLDEGASVANDNRYSSRFTALMLAAWGGQVKLAERILELGGDLEAKIGAKDTPLALSVHYPKMVEFLLAQGAEATAKNVFGETALMLAVDANVPKSVRLLLEKSDVNARDKEGLTALMRACKNPVPEPKIVSLLIKAGADVNARTEDGKSALSFISEGWKKSDEKKAVMLKHGATL